MPELKIPYTSMQERYLDNKSAVKGYGVFVGIIIIMSIVGGFRSGMWQGIPVVIVIFFALVMISVARLNNKIELNDKKLSYNIFGLMNVSYYKRRIPLGSIKYFSIQQETLIVKSHFHNRSFYSLTQEELGQVKQFLLEHTIQEKQAASTPK